ncbi:hypothetical protein [Bradyrhizobium sp. SRL28]|uniref:hypothetical protein n=1 Tax=Bradyrhizobium sp. SRL28 TaxID=2836178 RepID=UPI00201C37A8|nr:hypothetical protein [Bradyrhizobium sp. SRL28]
MTSHFTLPPSSGTLIAPHVEHKGVAAVYLAIAQYQDAADFIGCAVVCRSAQRIESIPNHYLFLRRFSFALMAVQSM